MGNSKRTNFLEHFHGSFVVEKTRGHFYLKFVSEKICIFSSGDSSPSNCITRPMEKWFYIACKLLDFRALLKNFTNFRLPKLPLLATSSTNFTSVYSTFYVNFRISCMSQLRLAVSRKQTNLCSVMVENFVTGFSTLCTEC